MKTNGEEEEFTPFKVSLDHVFIAIKDQKWARHPRPLPPNPKGLGVREYYVFHDEICH